MNDQRSFEHSLADRMEEERRGAQLPDAFYQGFQDRAGGVRQRPRWLALIKEPPMRTSSSLAVGSPMARVVAIAVATLLLAAVVAGAGIAGSRLLAAEEADFPTGTFVAAEWSDRFVEFNEDGTCRWVDAPGPADGGGVPCTYEVDGDLHTQTSYEMEEVLSYPPATYRWEFDGEYLTFELHGDDTSTWRRAYYEEQPYRYVPDPRLAVFADFDIAAGTEILAGHTDLRVAPGAEVPTNALADQNLSVGRVAGADIAAGTILTPDLFAAEETDFPTGTFVASEWSPRAVTFRDDGTCHWDFTPGVGAGMPCTYAVDGDLYTETGYEWEATKQHAPATYRWTYDGDLLTFELVGEDQFTYRRAQYEEQAYRFVPEPRIAVLAAFDIAAGTELVAGHTVPLVVPGADVPADAFIDKDLVAGRVAASDIPKGEPITPDLLVTE